MTMLTKFERFQIAAIMLSNADDFKKQSKKSRVKILMELADTIKDGEEGKLEKNADNVPLLDIL